MSTYTRATCSVCGRPIRVLKTGAIGPHNNLQPFVWPPKRCKGWGRLPAPTPTPTQP